MKMMVMMNLSYNLIFLLALLPSLASSAILGRQRREFPNQRSIKVMNMGKRRIDIFWMNTQDGSLVTQSEGGEGYAYGADTSILSYIGHRFKIVEMPGKKSQTCVHDECRFAYFTVQESEGQEVVLNSNFEIEFTDLTTRAEKKAQRLLNHCQSLMEENDDPLSAVDAMADCMSKEINDTLTKEEEEIQFQSTLSQTMSTMIPSYVCGDPEVETSMSLQNKTWNYEIFPGEYKEYKMQVYHERPTSKIFEIPEFIGRSECMALEAAMTRENPNDNYKVPFTAVNGKSGDALLIHTFASKMYELARVTLEWRSLDFQDQYNQGQELFDVWQDDQIMDIPDTICKSPKKKGDEDEDDSDGTAKTVTIDSDGQLVVTSEDVDDSNKSCRLPGASPIQAKTEKLEATGSHVATMFLFCNPPRDDKLGGIHFPRAGIHVNPTRGSAVVAMHRNLQEDSDVKHDTEYDGFVSEYHMCPHHHVYTHTFREPNLGA